MDDAKTKKQIGDLIPRAVAEVIGREVFARAILNTGHVVLAHVVDHKKAIGVTGAYGEATFFPAKDEIDRALKIARES